ncbi:Membrane protein involved in the export of O-antigen and teichoic acid [Halorubrum aquaticum]|uniref:Membrane protein involved in the export of O-antigen and teichoic acid n=1 Tax=Halorubrum aquaticum TaxID=387340 RepID=A0A1I3B2L0_9EURY|nr:flippase [Halorubrum aquaticum]SFH56547.1 Membrane protein involved in the export of O-antigen and teichoic acid [Halorubrum aquaticum]
MRLGQTSVVHFGSRFLASALGFAATVFIARFLGSSTLGTYYLVLSTVSWLGIVVTMGIPESITKRVSENDGGDQSAYAIAGVTLGFALLLAMAILVFSLERWVNDYIGYPASGVIVAFLFVKLAQSTVSSTLNGQRLVHVSGIFNPIRTGTRSLIQIGAILVGYGIGALFVGYAVGYLFVAVIGGMIVLRGFERIALPTRTHYRQIAEYAKFSWLGSLRSRAFNWVDVAVLGFFVSSSLVGIYTAAWNIAVFLILFGGSLSETLFPEMSALSAEKGLDSVSDLFETALAYAGLILIPGLVGGILLGERLLLVYGEEFTRGATVLSVLILATLIQGYQRQFTATLNAVDRPDLAFRINAVFIVANVVLNVGLIPFYGVIGAAGATAASVGVSLVVAYATLSRVLEFSVPTDEIARQWVSAGAMGVVVYGLLQAESAYLDINSNLVIVLFLVFLGAGAYFLSLLGVSARFRKTVVDNIPDRLIPEWIGRG